MGIRHAKEGLPTTDSRGDDDKGCSARNKKLSLNRSPLRDGRCVDDEGGGAVFEMRQALLHHNQVPKIFIDYICDSTKTPCGLLAVHQQAPSVETGTMKISISTRNSQLEQYKR